MSTKNLFTDKYLKNLKPFPDQKKAVDIREKSGDGFAITLHPSGNISFIYLYHFGNRKRRMTIGRYPHMSLAEAKTAHRDALKVLQNNQDPAELVKLVKLDTQNSSTVAGLINEYLEVWAKPRKRSWREDERMLDKDVKPKWGKRKASDITKRDVILLLEGIIARGSHIAANRTLSCIRRMFNFGVERDLLTSNPCVSIKPPSKENRRERSLSAHEISHLWNYLGKQTQFDDGTPTIKMSDATRLALKFQLVTAQRKGEVVAAEWSEFDFVSEVWTIPSGKAKNGKAHRVPLSKLAIALLSEIREKINHQRWLFPANHTVKSDTHMTGEAIDHALRRSKAAITEITDFSPHTLRATAATHMASMRISGEIISKILNHSKKGVTEQHYNKYEYDDEKRNALEAWSSRLMEIILGESDSTNIVRLKSAI